MIELNKLDPNSIGFRYGDVADGEYIISYHNLRDIMDEIFRVLKVVKSKSKL